MLRNYLLIAYRFLIRYKGYTVINILGLATGLACSIIIYLWILDELNYDKFHENYESIYRLVQAQQYTDGEFKVAATPAPMVKKFDEEFPEILKSARFRPYIKELLFTCGDKKFYDNGYGYVDPDFFDIFSFKIKEGSLEQFKELTTSMLITESFARKCFGQENPIGKDIMINQSSIYTVVGVVEDVPSNSHLQFNALVPFKRLEEIGWNISWNNNYYYAYVLFDNNIDYKSMNIKFAESAQEAYDYEIDQIYYLQPLSEIHLKSDFNIDVYSHTEIQYQYVYLFSVVGLIIILIVVINYMNLSTARATRRAREVGIRKVSGASRRQLIFQFIGESLILTIISYFIAIITVELLLPYINEFTGKALEVSYSNSQFVYGLLLILLFTGLLAGSYPAFYLSSFIPVNVLKGDIQSGSSLFRKVLVIFQFTLSIALIIGTFFVYKQLNYIQKRNLGIDREQILYTSIRGDLFDNFFSLKTELKNLSGVRNVTYANNIPTYTVNSSTGIDWEDRDTTRSEESHVLIHWYFADHDYVQTFDINLIEGRNFDLGRPADSSNFILNETAIKQMKLKDPIGKWFQFWGTRGYIIGIMKDFNFKSLHRPVEPLLLALNKNVYGYIFIKIDGTEIQKTIKEINNVWNHFNSEFPMDFKFLDEEYNKLYKSEQKLGRLFGIFAAIAIFLSCLGLFGLASYMTERRTKEIGIRKAHGASSQTITRMLTWEFTKWVIISMIIAWPFAYFYLDKWLQNFSYRTGLDYYIFILAGILVMFIAQISVLYQSLKASKANPATILKYE